MSAIRKGTCGMPGPYGAHCTEPPMHRYSCYDAGDDVSFNERMMRDDDLVHECNDPLCHGRTVLMSSSNDTEYTPTDVDVRVRYALDRGSAIQRPYSTALADFDRWLAAHDAELTERVRAEQREADAREIRAEMARDELALNDVMYEHQLPQLSRVMLNGATRFAERLTARSASFREAGKQ